MKRNLIFFLLASLPFCQVMAQGSASYRGLLDEYCNGCHNNEDWAGSIAFDLMSLDAVGHDAGVWETAIRKLRGRLMPPPGSDQPSQAEIDNFVSWLEGNLDSAMDEAGTVTGHVPVQRLNRTEYAIAIRELLGVDINPADYLPADIEVDGFDNIAAALSISPSFLEQYINVGRTVARLAVGQPQPKVSNAYFQVQSGDQDTYQPGFPLGTRGGMKVTHNFPADGEYTLNILDLDVGLYPRSIETRQTLVVLVDDEEIFREYIGGPEDFALVNKGGAPGRGKITERFANIPVLVKAGVHDITVTFIERARVETDENIGGFTPYGGFAFTGSLRVPRLLDGIQIVGPKTVSGVSMTPSREKIFVCEPVVQTEEKACATRIAENLARRAYRRPVTQEDLALLLPFFDMGRQGPGGFDEGVEQMVAAILASPDFLYRTISPMRDIGDAQVFALNDLELANRLSFFLWGQGPDDTLLDLAEKGELKQDGVLAAQARRMLTDERARHLVNSFAMKWLNLDELEVIDPDPALFPEFNDQMYDFFYEELKLFLGSVLLEDRPISDILNADYTFLNEPLARHYGIDDVHGIQFRRIQLEDERRWGILGKGATLLRTSYGDRTSPVLRGAWVLEKLMGTPPSPPPPNVETDLSVKPGQKFTTLRARLEQHRSKPGCNQCHGVIDPIGLALENFTVTGAWRDVDIKAEAPIDASTVLPNGKPINGVVELRQELASRPQQFAWAITQRLMMYALNRELEYFDMPQVRAIVRQAADQDYRLSALVSGIVNSEAFHMQGLPHEASSQVAGVMGE